MPEPQDGASPREDTARIHLHVLGEEHTVCVPLPLGGRTPLDLLPAARELTGRATGVALEQARQQGRSISCGPACGACCRQLVAISMVEARALADLVAAMPAQRQATIRERFAAAIRRLEEAGLLDPTEARGERALLGQDLGSPGDTARGVAYRYFQQKIACPFLEDESCGIYQDRPLVCREYHVTTPAERCARLYQEEVDGVPPPVKMGQVLAHSTHRTHGTSDSMIPLVQSLEWSEACGAVLDTPKDGMALFQEMMGEIDRQYQTAFQQRDAGVGMSG